MLRSDRGQTAAEYMGMLLIVSLLVAALATSSVATGLSEQVAALVCDIGGGGLRRHRHRRRAPTPRRWPAGSTRSRRSSTRRAARWRSSPPTRAPRSTAATSPPREDLIERLELYRELIEAGPRGALVDDLVSPTDADFAALLERGTIQFDGGAHNLRYFQVPPEPGQGILVMDLFIPGESAGPLSGDDRGFANPLRDPALGITDSRGMIVIDRETGRGVIVQSESCTASAGGRSSATSRGRSRSTATSGFFENDSENDATGEGVNIDVVNGYDVHADGDGVRIEYESRNSVSPFPAISGDLTFQPGDDGRLDITEDDRDGFPAYATYQYRPGERRQRDRAPRGRQPARADHPARPARPADLPDLPGPLPDLPDLPDLPQLPDVPNPPNLPDLPDLPNLPDLPGPLPDLPDLPNLPDLPG